MADADRPQRAVGIASAEIQIAAGVDREITERPELARGGVDGESFRDGAEIDRQRTAKGDRSRVIVDPTSR